MAGQRRSKKPSKRTLLKNIHKAQADLMNRYHIPCGFIYYVKRKVKVYGSHEVKDTLQNITRNDQDQLIKNVMKSDQNQMNQHTDTDYWPVSPAQAFDEAEKESPFPDLPFPIAYLNFGEGHKWTIDALMIEHKLSGGKREKIVYGHQDFAAPWWREHVWPWQTAVNIKNMPKEQFPGDSVTYFLRDTVRSCLEYHGINEDDLLDPLMDKPALFRRMRKRGHHHLIPRYDGTGSDDSDSSDSSAATSRENSANSNASEENQGQGGVGQNDEDVQGDVNHDADQQGQVEAGPGDEEEDEHGQEEHDGEEEEHLADDEGGEDPINDESASSDTLPLEEEDDVLPDIPEEEDADLPDIPEQVPEPNQQEIQNLENQAIFRTVYASRRRRAPELINQDRPGPLTRSRSRNNGGI